jgi:hypothetical protein
MVIALMRAGIAPKRSIGKPNAAAAPAIFAFVSRRNYLPAFQFRPS